MIGLAKMRTFGSPVPFETSAAWLTAHGAPVEKEGSHETWTHYCRDSGGTLGSPD